MLCDEGPCFTQDNSSGCEGQSSCTVMAPSAKRSREEGNTTTTTSPLMSMGSLESSALNFGKGHIDVVEDSERHLPTASMGDTEMTECNGTHVRLSARPVPCLTFAPLASTFETALNKYCHLLQPVQDRAEEISAEKEAEREDSGALSSDPFSFVMV